MLLIKNDAYSTLAVDLLYAYHLRLIASINTKQYMYRWVSCRMLDVRVCAKVTMSML